MTLEECYAALGGDCADALGRFGTPARLQRYLRLLPADDSIPRLLDAWQMGSTEDACRAAHALHGLSLTLGLTQLAEAACALTCALREHRAADAQLDNVCRKWQQTVQTLAQMTD